MNYHPTEDMRGLSMLRRLALCGILLASACSDDFSSLDTTAPDVSESASPFAATEPGVPASKPDRLLRTTDGRLVKRDRMHANLVQLARRIALALGDAEARQDLRQSLRASGFPEHKLHVRSYLERKGSTLLARTAAAAERPANAILASLDSLVDLEMYMPVPGHLERWAGDTELMVAAQINDGDPLIGFTLDGNPVRLSPAVAPTTPTLVLVQSETDFGRPLLAHEMCTPETCSGGGGGGTPTYPAGLYMQYSHLSDTHEGWPRGSPELEADLTGPINDLNDMHLVSCSHEGAAGYKRYNQDDNTWTGWAQVADSAELERIRSAYPPGTPWSEVFYTVAFWEDDTDRCVIYQEHDNWTSHMLAATMLFVGGSSVITANHPEDWDDSDFLAMFMGVLAGSKYFYDLLTGADDDFVGTTVASDDWNAVSGDNVTQHLTVIRDNARVGEVEIRGVGFNAP